MTNASILLYFDLRKYIYIEKNKTYTEVIDILSDMHSIIDKGKSAIFAKNYKIHTDTSVYILDDISSENSEAKIKEIKIDVDTYMKKNGLPSVLHICIIYGNYYSGFIKTENINQYNIFGEIMNKLEKYLYIIDNSHNKELNEEIYIL